MKQVLDRMEAVAHVSGPPRTGALQPDQVHNLNVRLDPEFGMSSLSHRFDKTIAP